MGVACEARHECIRVGRISDPEQREVDASEPPLSSDGDASDVVELEVDAGRPEELRRLLRRNLEVAGADLGQIAVSTKPSRGQPGLEAARDNELNVGGGTLDELGQGLLGERVSHRVPVIEDQHQLRRAVELVDQEWEHGPRKRVWSRSQGCETPLSDSGVDGVEPRDQVRPEPHWVGVLTVEREPDEWLARRDPPPPIERAASTSRIQRAHRRA